MRKRGMTPRMAKRIWNDNWLRCHPRKGKSFWFNQQWLGSSGPGPGAEMMSTSTNSSLLLWTEDASAWKEAGARRRERINGSPCHSPSWNPFHGRTAGFQCLGPDMHRQAAVWAMTSCHKGQRIPSNSKQVDLAALDDSLQTRPTWPILQADEVPEAHRTPMVTRDRATRTAKVADTIPLMVNAPATNRAEMHQEVDLQLPLSRVQMPKQPRRRRPRPHLLPSESRPELLRHRLLPDEKSEELGGVDRARK